MQNNITFFNQIAEPVFLARDMPVSNAVFRLSIANEITF